MVYGFETTAEEIANAEKVNLNGKNVIVTGGYTGMKQTPRSNAQNIQLPCGTLYT